MLLNFDEFGKKSNKILEICEIYVKFYWNINKWCENLIIIYENLIIIVCNIRF